MEIKLIIRRILVDAAIIIVTLILQLSVFSKLPLGGVTPNILICVVATYGFMKGQKYGLIVGLICGFFLDFFSGFYLGFYALIYMLIGYLNGFFKKLFFGDELRLPLLLIGTSDFLFGLINYAVLLITYQKFDINFYLVNIIMPEVVYTLVISIFVYYAILKINNGMEQLDKRGSNRLNGLY